MGSKAYLAKPIFREESPEDVENWSGFFIGGMAQTNELSLARAYKSAGDVIVAKALRSIDLAYEWAFPALFLYRHAIELYLKLIVQPEKPTHGIMKLTRQFKSLVRSRLKKETPEWVIDRIREFSDIDPVSQTFRYTTKGDGSHNWVPGEFWVSFVHLRRTVNELAKGFENAYFALPREPRPSKSKTKRST